MLNINEWEDWKKTLGRVVDIGETIGLSDKSISNVAEKIGTFLSNNVEPRNDEERLLKEMWDVSDIEDRNVLAKIIVRISDK